MPLEFNCPSQDGNLSNILISLFIQVSSFPEEMELSVSTGIICVDRQKEFKLYRWKTFSLKLSVQLGIKLLKTDIFKL